MDINKRTTQTESLWNLVQTSDDEVQRQIFFLLSSKYGLTPQQDDQRYSFLKMKGRLKGKGSLSTDQKMLDDYLTEKYQFQ